MTLNEKARSPFSPDQPVALELFVGRDAQIQRILQRGVSQVARGKSVAFFIQGEYGIGKTSIAAFVQGVAEKEGLHGIYVQLGGARGLLGMAEAILRATIESGALDPKRSERLRQWLARFIGKQELFHVTLNFEALRAVAPTLSNPGELLRFLGEARDRLADTGVTGVCLILDELNGVASDPEFAHFLKGLWEENALSTSPVPLLLLVCGIADRRGELIRNHRPVERLFDVVEIEVMSTGEMEEFFRRAFESVGTEVEPAAMELLCKYSGGLPKFMHLVGNEAFWADQDGLVDAADARGAVVSAAEEVGRRYVEQQIYEVLRSDDYRSILAKVAEQARDDLSFKKAEVRALLAEGEAGKLDNFLQKMKRLNVLRAGRLPGDYIFNSRMVCLYLRLRQGAGFATGGR